MTKHIKTNLHFHTCEDPKHKAIKYTLKEGIDEAANLGFEALAITCHESFKWENKASEYANSKGVLLIPGIEAKIRFTPGKPKKEVIILNCHKDIEKISNIEELKKYKNAHPEVFILAPHPFFYGNFSLKKDLEKNIEVFNAIEQSWFYSRIFNRNKKAKKVAEKYNLPFISTSDTHFLNFLNTDYAMIYIEEKTPEAIFRAIKEKSFKNITRTKNSFTEMLVPQGLFMLKDFAKKVLR